MTLSAAVTNKAGTIALYRTARDRQSAPPEGWVRLESGITDRDSRLPEALKSAMLLDPAGPVPATYEPEGRTTKAGLRLGRIS